MKKAFSLVVSACITLAATAQKNNVFVKAAIPGIPAGEWIYYNGMNGNVRDSVQPDAKGFNIAMHIPEGEGDFYMISIGKLRAGSGEGTLMMLFLEKGTIQLKSNTASFKDAVLSGGKDAAYYNAFQQREKVQGLNELQQQLMDAQSKGDTAFMNRGMARYRQLNQEQRELDMKWFAKNAGSTAIVYPVYQSLRSMIPLNTMDSLFQLAKPSAKNNLVVKKIEHSIKTDKLTGIGRTALDFSQTDTAGKMVSLKDFRGKYVLVDFWASWCVPCRIENPHVVSAFQQYKDKNFTVLGVSFDMPGKHDKWVQAIHDDQLYWNHVSDLKHWDNAAGRLYDIRSIPSNVLIDPNGIIVGKNLRGEALDKKLHELLGAPALAKNTFIIKGNVTGTKGATWFHISYEGQGGKTVRDSVKLFSGAFAYIGKIEQPTQAYFYFKGENEQRVDFSAYKSAFVEPGVSELKGNAGDVKSLVLKGGAVQAEMEAFEKLTAAYKAGVTPLNERYNAGSMAYANAKRAGASEEALEEMKLKLEHIRDSMQPYSQKMREANMAYFKAHPASYITLSQLRFYTSSMKVEEAEAIFAKMTPEMKASAQGKEIAKEIANMRSGSPGSMATNFSGMDITGKPLSLTDFRGKYVLVDFWASWCVPCRKGNPHLLQLYSKYKKKGFEIIGVSDDDSNHEAWKKAVEKDGIGVWKHVLRGLKKSADGSYDRSEDKSEAYGIHTLPTKILIDPQGKIVGRYGGGGENDEAMDKKLAEIFK